MSRTSDLTMAISQDIKYALGLVKAGKDPTFWLDRASGYAFELVGANPAAAPTPTAVRFINSRLSIPFTPDTSISLFLSSF